MKNTFKISQELKPYIRQLLSRSEIPFRIKTKEGQVYILTDLSGTKFHNIVQRAKCMKLSKETGVLHITKRESENEAFVMSLLQETNETAYVIAGTKK